MTTESGSDFAQAARDPERLHLAVEVEAVARLDLEGRDAVAHQRLDAPAGAGEKLVLALAACCTHGRDDAAAGARDLVVGGAGQPQLELVRAVAAIDDVRVAIDQAGRDPAALAVDRLGRLEGRGIGLGTGIDDAAVRRRDDALLDNSEARRGRHGGKPRAAPDAVTLHAATLADSCPRLPPYAKHGEVSALRGRRGQKLRNRVLFDPSVADYRATSPRFAQGGSF